MSFHYAHIGNMYGASKGFPEIITLYGTFYNTVPDHTSICGAAAEHNTTARQLSLPRRISSSITIKSPKVDHFTPIQLEMTIIWTSEVPS